MRNAMAHAIIKKAQIDPKLFLISGDAGLGVWDNFRESKQYINPGINEALCVGMAAGMALRGYRTIYYNIAPFVIMRPYEQVRNDICYQKLPVILVGTGSGVTYAPAGMTHYAIEDIALALTCPNLDIFSPSDPIEAKEAFEYAYKNGKPSYIRVPKAGEPLLHRDENIDITAPQILHKGNDVVVISHSSILKEALEAAEILACAGISAQIVSLPMITTKNPKLDKLLNFSGEVFVVEEHFERGGLGSLLAEKRKINKIALPNEYIHAIGNQNYIREYYGINAQAIAKKIEAKIKE